MSRTLANADVFHAIADPTRRRLLELLTDGERAVTQLVEAFAISQPSISAHLRVLRDVGLVSVRRAGRQRFYGLEATHLREVAVWAAFFDRFWDRKLDDLVGYMNRNANTEAGGEPPGPSTPP